MDSAGADIYLAATEDTMIKAKTADQMIMLENCFMNTFPLGMFVLFVQNDKSKVKDMQKQISCRNLDFDFYT